MTLSIVLLIVGAFICVAAPTLAAVIMIIKRKGRWYMFVLGIISFTVSQLLLRIPLLGELQNTAWFNMFMITQSFLLMMALALSAGVFEETGRYLALRFLHRDLLTWENGLLFGLGHGGVEAFWIAGLPYINVIADALSGKNTASLLLATPIDMLMGGVERILAVAMHIGFTMLVLYAVKRRNIWWFILAVFVHGLVDATTTLLAVAGVRLSLWGIEGVLAVFAALAVILTVRMKPIINAGIVLKNERAEI
jgi:uncharacterized membrane protein YhfC